MNFLTTQQLTQLRCIKCSNYLSFFPIYRSMDSAGHVCGRCTEDEYSSRNVVYEELAALQIFPCKNDINGCIDYLLPKEVPLHEQYCKYRKFSCPNNKSIGCKWQGTAIDLWGHCEKNHAEFIIKHDQFEFNFLENCRESLLLNFGNEPYVVNKTIENSRFSCKIYSVGSNTLAPNYLYKLEFQNASCRDVKLTTLHKLGEETSLDKEVVKSVLKNPAGVVAHIEILKREEKEKDEEYEEVQWDLVNELECCSCKEYMLPPVHQCKTGHSICSNCKNSQELCPTCKKLFLDTVNITLGKLIGHLIYPCKNAKQGCQYTCKSLEIRNHESYYCTYGEFKCPLSDYENCKEKLSQTNLYDHIVNDHHKNLGLEVDSVSRSNINEKVGIVSLENVEDERNFVYENCFVLKYNFRLFKLHFKYTLGAIYWEMQLIGAPKRNEKYEFEISYVGNNHRICFRKDCNSLSEKTDAFIDEGSFIVVMLSQIQNMFNDDELLVYNISVFSKTP